MHAHGGFTLLDLMIAITIVALLGAIAVPSYSSYADRANQGKSIAEVAEIQMALDQFNASGFAYPDSLDELTGIPRTDPWGSRYRYLRIEGNGTPGIRGRQRKDRNLNPLNSDYDLYSVGKNLDSRLPLTTPVSRDDIVRAGNGGFIGLAEDH